MRKLSSFFSLTVLLALSVSCSDDDNNNVNVPGNANAVANNIKSGTWRITNYTDDNVDGTAYFTDYDFDFNDNGQVVASNGTTTVEGVWSVTDDLDDDNSSSIDFDLAFAAPVEFAQLTEDWDVIERTGTRIVLADDNDDDDLEILVFEKN